MPTFINLNESKLMEYYEKMMDEVFLKYHTFPSEIPNIPISERDASLASVYNAEGRGHAANLPPSGGGKHVVHHTDPKYCNGLLRRR